eukprot:TRINITY_DN798_c1_g1_i1.p1 TRINITY_DN798_c1_g1~~TRINITY_DN798_c1_g1_i1.p1  ORF type:complete len:1184 (-),score=164.57 TRINITY_DN798_c1_g1_i1:545-3970(-)
MAYSVKGSHLPTFVFPEEGDSYFDHNVEALKTSINEALNAGCLDDWPVQEPTEIAVVFRHDSLMPDTSDFYIQYQVEQIAAVRPNETDVGFRSFDDHLEYQRKLVGALQIWESSPLQLEFLRRNLQSEPSQKLRYVPLWSSVGSNTDGICEDILQRPSCALSPAVDVLFFGFLTASRKQLCKNVEAELEHLRIQGQDVSHECVSSLFGEELQCKICKAKVIYSDHSRDRAVLEEHRISPLLILGKAVVSATSADKQLDAAYAGALELTAPQSIPEVVKALILDADARYALEWNAYSKASMMKAQAHPHLCSALQALSGMAHAGALPNRRSWLDGYAPHVVARRLNTTTVNGSNSSNGSSPLARTTVDVVGQSGKFYVYPEGKKRQDGILITMDALREVDAAGSTVGSGGQAKHSFNSFATQAFTVGQAVDVQVDGVPATKISFSSQISTVGELRVDTYVMKGFGQVGPPDETWQVAPGDLKWNIEFPRWAFCSPSNPCKSRRLQQGNGGGNSNNGGGNGNGNGNSSPPTPLPTPSPSSSSSTLLLPTPSPSPTPLASTPSQGSSTVNGEFIDLDITVAYPNSKGIAHRGGISTSLSLSDGMNLELSQKVQVDGSWVSMPAGYPAVTLEAKSSTFTFRFPKFSSTAMYDPLITGVAASSTAPTPLPTPSPTPSPSPMQSPSTATSPAPSPGPSLSPSPSPASPIPSPSPSSGPSLSPSPSPASPIPSPSPSPVPSLSPSPFPSSVVSSPVSSASPSPLPMPSPASSMTSPSPSPVPSLSPSPLPSSAASSPAPSPLSSISPTPSSASTKTSPSPSPVPSLSPSPPPSSAASSPVPLPTSSPSPTPFPESMTSPSPSPVPSLSPSPLPSSVVSSPVPSPSPSPSPTPSPTPTMTLPSTSPVPSLPPSPMPSSAASSPVPYPSPSPSPMLSPASMPVFTKNVSDNQQAVMLSGTAELMMQNPEEFAADPNAKEGVTNAIAIKTRTTKGDIKVTLSVISLRRLTGRQLSTTVVKADYVIEHVLNGGYAEARSFATQLVNVLASVDRSQFAELILEETNIAAKAKDEVPKTYALTVRSITAPTQVAVKGPGDSASSVISVSELTRPAPSPAPVFTLLEEESGSTQRFEALLPLVLTMLRASVCSNS